MDESSVTSESSLPDTPESITSSFSDSINQGNAGEDGGRSKRMRKNTHGTADSGKTVEAAKPTAKKKQRKSIDSTGDELLATFNDLWQEGLDKEEERFQRSYYRYYRTLSKCKWSKQIC